MPYRNKTYVAFDGDIGRFATRCYTCSRRLCTIQNCIQMSALWQNI
jgi:hypothetical protein